MAQSVARRSHNPKVVSSILTGRISLIVSLVVLGWVVLRRGKPCWARMLRASGAVTDAKRRWHVRASPPKVNRDQNDNCSAPDCPHAPWVRLHRFTDGVGIPWRRPPPAHARPRCRNARSLRSALQGKGGPSIPTDPPAGGQPQIASRRSDVSMHSPSGSRRRPDAEGRASQVSAHLAKFWASAPSPWAWQKPMGRPRRHQLANGLVSDTARACSR